MTNHDYLKLENQLCFPIYAVSRAITKLYGPFLDELGITYPQYLVMLVLWEEQTITLKDLGARLYLDSGTLTPLLKRMETMKLITRERSSEDERLLLIKITQEGIDMKEKALSIPECVVKSINVDPMQLIKLKEEIDNLLKVIKHS